VMQDELVLQGLQYWALQRCVQPAILLRITTHKNPTSCLISIYILFYITRRYLILVYRTKVCNDGETDANQTQECITSTRIEAVIEAADRALAVK
jgi:hypothetical protein